MSGFPPRALTFYEDLEDDNSKAFWAEHKAEFVTFVKGPMEALRDALAPEFGVAKIFRPHRDVRFSSDKSPYKTHLGMVVGDGEGGAGALYTHLSAAGLLIAGGYYVMASDQVARYRAAVDSPRAVARLESHLHTLSDAGWTVGGDTLKTSPRGYDADHPQIGLLRHKSLTASQEHGRPAWLSTDAVAEHVAAGWRALLPLNGWLAEHVGASTSPRRGPGGR